MNTETMIRELNTVVEKHKNDFVPIFQTNIITMCRDIIFKLEQLAEYEAIGTVEECREAREKQRAKKPKIWTTPDDGVNLIYAMYKCPNCGKEYKIDYYDEYSYCPNCGQAVKLFE